MTLSRIDDQHLQRGAVVYIPSDPRPAQVPGQPYLLHQHQRSLLDTAIQLGFQPDSISTIAPDLDSPSQPRREWERLLARVIEGTGAVILRSLRRVAQHPSDVGRLTALCQAYDTLVIEDGRIVVASPLDPLAGSILDVITEYYITMQAERLMRAKYARVRAGFAVTPPPGGYELSGRGQWTMDRVPEVRHAYAGIFSEFLERESVSAVTTFYRQRDIAASPPRGPTGTPTGNLQPDCRDPAQLRIRGRVLFWPAPDQSAPAGSRPRVLAPLGSSRATCGPSSRLCVPTGVRSNPRHPPTTQALTHPVGAGMRRPPPIERPSISNCSIRHTP